MGKEEYQDLQLLYQAIQLLTSHSSISLEILKRILTYCTLTPCSYYYRYIT